MHPFQWLQISRPLIVPFVNHVIDEVGIVGLVRLFICLGWIDRHHHAVDCFGTDLILAADPCGFQLAAMYPSPDRFFRSLEFVGGLLDAE